MGKQPHRWVSVLVSAQEHKDLTVLALDESTTLAELLRTLIREFLEGRKHDNIES